MLFARDSLYFRQETKSECYVSSTRIEHVLVADADVVIEALAGLNSRKFVLLKFVFLTSGYYGAGI